MPTCNDYYTLGCVTTAVVMLGIITVLWALYGTHQKIGKKKYNL